MTTRNTMPQLLVMTTAALLLSLGTTSAFLPIAFTTHRTASTSSSTTAGVRVMANPLPVKEYNIDTALTASPTSDDKNIEDSDGFTLPKFADIDFSVINDVLDSINIDSLTTNLQAGLQATLSQENIGKRGEIYTIGQFILVGAVLFGGIPVVGDILNVVLGPGTFLVGLALLALSLGDLGTALSPWPSPASSSVSELKTEGIYSKMRHPMYAGLICTLLGYSILLGSATRLVLTGLLWAFLELKADKEEEFLLESYPGYASYMEQVTGKFIPAEVTNKVTMMLPQSKE